MHSAIVKGVKEICDVSNREMLDLMEITDDVRKQIGKILKTTKLVFLRFIFPMHTVHEANPATSFIR